MEKQREGEELSVEGIIQEDTETVKYADIHKFQKERVTSQLCVLHQAQFKAFHIFILSEYLLN